MIAPADFNRPSMTMQTALATRVDYSEDRLIPGADPYIVQLMREHEEALLARSRATSFSRRSELRSHLEMAVA